MSGMRTPTPAAETAAPPCCWTCSIFQEPWGTHLPAARVQHLCKGRRAKASHTVAEMSCKHTMKFWKEAPTGWGARAHSELHPCFTVLGSSSALRVLL